MPGTTASTLPNNTLEHTRRAQQGRPLPKSDPCKYLDDDEVIADSTGGRADGTKNMTDSILASGCSLMPFKIE